MKRSSGFPSVLVLTALGLAVWVAGPALAQSDLFIYPEQEQAAVQQQQIQEQQTALERQRAAYNRALIACLEARDYSVQ